MDRLARYRAMRDFAATPEPQGGRPSGTALRYGMQMHDATRLHWDLRLEWQGVLLSWAVTRGPSTDPTDKRLAVRTEDHPLDYLMFEGPIPKGSYGAGTVMLWDIGWWQPHHDVERGLAEGHLHFALHGRRATGGWSLVRLRDAQGDRQNWLMVKDKDEAAVVGEVPFAERHVTSVATGRTLPEIADGAPARPAGPERKGPVPAFRAVQLAETVAAPPEGDSWLHEVKLDGYRAQVAIGRQGVRIRTRSGADWTDRFAELVPVLADLPCDTALIDGEVMAGAGLSGFAALQGAIKAGGPFRYYAFDLLWLDGADLASRPLRARREALGRLLSAQPVRGPLQLSPAIDGSARAALDAVCGAGGEGLVSKLADAPYRSGRSAAWVKSKCLRRDEFVIVGWQRSPSRGRPFASLLLASHRGGALAYTGKVGTGWDGDDMDEIAALLKPLARAQPPLALPDGLPRGIAWVEPRLVAEVAFAERTPGGLLRHARFVALREDKPAAEVREVRVSTGPDDTTPRTPVAGIGISSPRRVVFPKVKVTKVALAEYHAAMADRILPTLARRPLSLLRLPEGLDGERFFQKHATEGFPDAIRRVPIADAEGGTEAWMTVDDAAGLVAAVQMGTVEFHPWGARIDRPDRPERLVFDLDPDESLGFAEVTSAAITLRDRLADLGLGSWAMLSGGKGVHVVVPLRRTAGWETAKLFAQVFARMLAEVEPHRFTATVAKRARRGRIFIDWMRNERGATAVAPFTVRARPTAPVAMPVAWDELGTMTRADAFGMEAARERAWSDLAMPSPAALGKGVLDRLARMGAA
jgi:bifunctional non-homologous end joining protein LigD